MKAIDGIPEDEKRHFLKCDICGNYFDCRNLGDVLMHTHETLPKGDFIYSKEVSKPIAYLKGKIAIVQN